MGRRYALRRLGAVWLFALWLSTRSLGQMLPEPKRPIDLWNPFGTTSTPRPKNEKLHEDEVIVRLPIGDIIGKKVVLHDLPWTANEDPIEQMPDDRSHFDPNPLPPKNNVSVFTFLGIPFAEPPVGQRRLKPPQQLVRLPGDGPFTAFAWGPSCAQDVENRPSLFIDYPYDNTVDEDCLYLNVFSPETSRRSSLVFPVIVFFHGGNFQTGSAHEWPAHGLASRGLVVVTVNYRLGALGFLSLGDSDTGNYGLQDQRLALLWVRDNIAAFGGDPQAVTVMGHDAGAASVGLHMLTPLSKGLFRSAIAMSGAEVSYHSTIGKPALAYNNTIKLGRYLGCAETLPQNVWDCILTRSSDDIVRATTSIPIEYNRYLFLPSVDGWQIPANPLWMWNNAPLGIVNIPSPVPYLTGISAQDGTEVILENRYLGEFNSFHDIDYQMMRSFAIEYAFRHNYSMNREATAEAIVDRYTFWPDIGNTWAIRDEFIHLTTDAYYVAPVALSAHLHSQAGSRTFLYVNNYNFSRARPEDIRFVPDWMGVFRDSDLLLAFAYPHMPKELRPQHLRNVTFTWEDRNASQLFTSIIRRFAEAQNPNFLNDGTWMALEPRRHWYLNFNFSGWEEMRVPGRLERDYKYRDVAFWNEYVPALVNYFTTTFPPQAVVDRRTTVVLSWTIGIETVLLMIFVILAFSFGYLYCVSDDESRAQEMIEREQLQEIAMNPLRYEEKHTFGSATTPTSSRISAL